MGAVISIWSEIGEWAIVAEGSVVKLKQIILPEIVVAGNPAKIIRDVTEKDKDFWNWGKKIYIDLAKKYLDIGMKPLNGIIEPSPRQAAGNLHRKDNKSDFQFAR